MLQLLTTMVWEPIKINLTPDWLPFISTISMNSDTQILGIRNFPGNFTTQVQDKRIFYAHENAINKK